MEFPLLAMLQEQGLKSTTATDSTEEAGTGFAEIFSGIREELLAGLFADPDQAPAAAEPDPANVVSEVTVAESPPPIVIAGEEPLAVSPDIEATASATDAPAQLQPTNGEPGVSETGAASTEVAMATSLPASATASERNDGTVTENRVVTESALPHAPRTSEEGATPAGPQPLAPETGRVEARQPALVSEATSPGATTEVKVGAAAVSNPTPDTAPTVAKAGYLSAAHADAEEPVPGKQAGPAPSPAATEARPESDADEDSVALLERLAQRAPKNATAVQPRRIATVQETPAGDLEVLSNAASNSSAGSESMRGAVPTDTAMRPADVSTPASSDPPSTEAPLQRASLDQAPAQAVRSIRYLLGNGERRITVRLIPESLGEIHVEVHSKGAEVSVRMVAANPAVRETLDAQVQGLREALNREGISVDKIDVSAGMTADSGPSHHAGREAAQSNPSQGAASFLSGPGYQDSAGEPDATTARVSVHEGALNLYV